MITPLFKRQLIYWTLAVQWVLGCDPDLLLPHAKRTKMWFRAESVNMRSKEGTMQVKTRKRQTTWKIGEHKSCEWAENCLNIIRCPRYCTEKAENGWNYPLNLYLWHECTTGWPLLHPELASGSDMKHFIFCEHTHHMLLYKLRYTRQHQCSDVGGSTALQLAVIVKVMMKKQHEAF